MLFSARKSAPSEVPPARRPPNHRGPHPLMWRTVLKATVVTLMAPTFLRKSRSSGFIGFGISSSSGRLSLPVFKGHDRFTRKRKSTDYSKESDHEATSKPTSPDFSRTVISSANLPDGLERGTTRRRRRPDTGDLPGEQALSVTLPCYASAHDRAGSSRNSDN